MRTVLIIFLLLLLILPQTDAREKREALYRLNNIGVALMEQFKHEDAIREFKKILATDPGFVTARINLALAYYFLNDSRNAVSEAREALKISPSSPHANYVLGATLKKEREYQEALKAFSKILETDSGEPISNIQIGQVYSQLQQYDRAIEAFKRALEAESYNATAAYSLAQAYNRSARAKEGREMLDLFQKLRASGYATTLGLNYGEQGRYAEAVTSTGAEPELVSPEAAPIRFIERNSSSTLQSSSTSKLKIQRASSVLGRRITRADFQSEATRRELISAFSPSISMGDVNGDDRLDLFVTGVDDSGKPTVRLLQNSGTGFTDVTTQSKLGGGPMPCGAVFGDFDNDSRTDIVVFGYSTLELYRNAGDGTFANVTSQSGLPAASDLWAQTAALTDSDHDGDLDILVGYFADMRNWPGGESAVFPDDFAGQGLRLFRNNGNGTFTDITEAAKLGGAKRKTTAIVCSDFNNLRDIDFVVASYGAPLELFSNQRDGTFKDIETTVGLSSTGKTLGIGAGDLNKDSFVDFYVAGYAARDLLFLSDGRGKFTRQEIESAQTLAVQVVDYDNDGLLDVITLSDKGIELRRGLGRSLAAAVHVPLTGAGLRVFATGDIDADGGTDIAAITEDGTWRSWRSEGASKNFTRIKLNGKASNRSGIGTKAEIRSGSLAQKLEVYASSPAAASAGISFGLGYRTTVDSLRLLWPSGILQSELSVKTGAINSFDELDRKGTSCPLLYAWNGSEYTFVTDFLGGSAIGYLTAPGSYNFPDTDEYVRVTGEQLRSRDGIYSLRMNNQLEEVIYFDAVKLVAIDHPRDTEVFPNERLMPGPPYPGFKVFSVKGARPPVAAIDDRATDILSLISSIDRKYPDGFEELKFKGYAREHSIELDPGSLNLRDRVLLLLTAWIDYADSTSNVAASQAGVKLIPPYLQVKNARGEWQTVIEQMGFPAGLPKTMTVDLSGKFLCDDMRVRIVTSMRIYWDQILIAVSPGSSNFSGDAPTNSTMISTTLSPMRAELRYRGYPREYSPDNRLPLIYDYRVIDADAPWKVHAGNYTRFGDVRELLGAVDDMYVITRSGDEVQVDFDAKLLPRVPPGWKRDFLFFADGFGKDMDLNSARPDTIGELPYHRMKSYPYSASDSYPISRQHQEYLERYNTRTYRSDFISPTR
jgi:Tfp pilus assembly protein PilF